MCKRARETERECKSKHFLFIIIVRGLYKRFSFMVIIFFFFLLLFLFRLNFMYNFVGVF